MDLSSATSSQQQIITTLDAPLSVSAGAGSGKTFTLTNRIGYALVGEAGAKDAFIDGIDEVLATTFSKSGAAEMKSRVRSLLQQEGLDEQALMIEDAWITTIHGLCARILREHALELGIDPGFEVVEKAESEELWYQALDSVLKDISDEGTPRSRGLFDWYPKTKSPFGGEYAFDAAHEALGKNACYATRVRKRSATAGRIRPSAFAASHDRGGAGL